MITRIVLKNFKSFDDVDASLAPMQVFVGVNAAGKSNVFDALLLLQRITQQDLMSAFVAGRGDIEEYFTRSADGYADQMTLSVELLLPHSIEDDWGTKAEIKFNRLRYTVVIERQSDQSGRMNLIVKREELAPIKRESDELARDIRRKGAAHWLPPLRGGRSIPFISTNDSGGTLLHQDGRGGKQTKPPGLTRSVLSGVSNAEFPHALAVKSALDRITLLQLDPSGMRTPSPFEAPDRLTPSGDNLAAVLARLGRGDKRALRNISTDVASIVSGFSDLRVDEDPQRRLYTLWARVGEESYSAQVLSDGTLRLIALVALKYDPSHGGTLLFEEPENGVHPQRLEQMASVLKELAAHLSTDDPMEWPRQVMVNTHSPQFMAKVIDSELMLVMPVGFIAQNRKARRSRLLPVKTAESPLLEIDQFVARHEVERMLETDTLASARKMLSESLH